MLLNWLTFHVDKIGGFPLHGCLAPSFAADQTARFHQLYPFGGGTRELFPYLFLIPADMAKKATSTLMDSLALVSRNGMPISSA
jgi:hypothetical protein